MSPVQSVSHVTGPDLSRDATGPSRNLLGAHAAPRNARKGMRRTSSRWP